MWILLFVPDNDQDAGHKTGSSCYQTTRPQATVTAVVRHWVIRRVQQPQTDPGYKQWQPLLHCDLDVNFFFGGHTLKINPYVPSYAFIAFVTITNKHTPKQLLPFLSLSCGIFKAILIRWHTWVNNWKKYFYAIFGHMETQKSSLPLISCI